MSHLKNIKKKAMAQFVIVTKTRGYYPNCWTIYITDHFTILAQQTKQKQSSTYQPPKQQPNSPE